MEFGDPVHMVGIAIFITFISLMIGSQILAPEKEHKKPTDC
ncbi:hypothetical protein B481_2030 [Planococcus halocryophilus Or1]|nr:hypothetical protein [Planococcus halocryophilus]EMF46303.1 hypothetical protein B481_2030 [Planococcus halocryophilus Or1]